MAASVRIRLAAYCQRTSLKGLCLFLGLFLLLTAHSAFGKTMVKLATDAAPLHGRWTCLRIALPKKLVGKRVLIHLRDPHGGPEIICRSATDSRLTLVPMVFASVKHLPPGHWPLELRVSHGAVSGKWRRVGVDLPESKGEAQQIAASPGTRGQIAGLQVHGILRSVIIMPVTRRQLLTASPLCFSGCRWLLVGKRSVALLTTARLESLLAIGVNILFTGFAPPANGQHLSWQPWRTLGTKTRTDPTLWRLYAAAPTPVIIRRLARLRLEPVQAPAAWWWLSVLCGPLVLMIVVLSILAAGRSKKVGTFLVFLSTAALGLAGFGYLYLRASTHPTATEFRWTTRNLKSPLAVRRRLTFYRSLRPDHVFLPAKSHCIQLPLSSSAREWFSLRGKLRLHADGNSVRLAIAADQSIVMLSQRWETPPQSIAPSHLPPHRKQLAEWVAANPAFIAKNPQAVALLDGRIFRLAQPGQAHDFYQWMARQARPMQADLRAWFALEFQASHKYVMQDRGQGKRRGLYVIQAP